MIEYRIYQSVYDEIISGNNNMEIRLLNAKSQALKIGDKIKFQVENSSQYIIVEIENKYVFSNVDELWENKDTILKRTNNYTKEEYMNEMFKIFGKDKVLSSKIVGIKFNIINNESDTRH